jgi:hypothetical protein
VKRLVTLLVALGCAAPAPAAIAPWPVITIGRTGLDLKPLLSIKVHLPPAIRVCAGGDVMLGSDLDTTWAVRRGVSALPDPFGLTAPLRPLVSDASILLLNVEGAIGSGTPAPKCRPGSTSCYAFRQPPEAAASLRAAHPTGAVVGNVANNHAMDAGPDGFDQTVAQLARAGVFPTGYDTLPTLVPLPSGDTVAFLGFSTFRAGPDARDLAGVRRHVARSAARWPRTIVTWHHGAEGVGAQRTADEPERFLGEDRGNPVAFARAAVESGAVVVFGHGPHVLRAMQWLDDRLVVYSLGNLLTYGPFSLVEPLNRGGLACARLDPTGRVLGVEFRSTYQVPPGVMALDPGERGAALIDSLGALDFPTTNARVFRQ